MGSQSRNSAISFLVVHLVVMDIYIIGLLFLLIIANLHSRKRKRNMGDDNLLEMTRVFHRFIDSSEARIEKLCRRIGHEVDVSEANKNINGELLKIPTLSREERLVAATLIAEKSSRVDVFFSLGDSDREAWVRLLLDKEI